jgi:TIR domain
MLSYTTYDDIRGINRNLDESTVIAKANLKQYKTVFLAHSSKDSELLPAVITILENHGGRVYVDKKDPRLPEKVATETAEILRDTIRACNKMVVLVSTNTKDSKWVPWELGLGDGIKYPRNVSLFPVVEKSYEKAWTEQEYLGLYNRIIWGTFQGKEQAEWMVYNHRTNNADKLKEWINK